MPNSGAFSRDLENPLSSGGASHCTKADAAIEIERSYDRLQRIQAILAYLHILKRQVQGIGEFLDEAKHTYAQSLGRYQDREFMAAREFGSACQHLCRIVEVVISRTLRSDTSYPFVVPEPPELERAFDGSHHLRRSFEELKGSLLQLQDLLKGTALSSEDRAQARKITFWSEAFFEQASRLYRRGEVENVVELVQFAKSAARSAEHIGRNGYIEHTRHRRSGTPESSLER
jgi:hypothetical protein